MSGSNSEEHTLFSKHCSIKLVPSETLLKFRKDISPVTFLKFRKDISTIRAGLNFKFYNASTKNFHAKLVLKPLFANPMLKVIYEPLHHEVTLLLKKTQFLNFQVGIGHNLQSHAINWKWKLTTSKHSGGDGISRLRKKTSFELFPGIDLHFWWTADYALPEYTGILSTFDMMHKAHLKASFDKVEAIFKIDTFQETRKQDKTKTVKKATT